MKAEMSISKDINRARIGLALGGGVVRGVAHIGVLTAMEEAGIEVDMIAGSSAGALIGAIYCSGVGAQRMQVITRKLNWLKLIQPCWPVQGFFTFEPLERWLESEFGPLQFDDLKIPFVAVATDLQTGEMVVLKEGKLAPAVRASCSVAGLVTPVRLGNRLLCDGNFSNSVPVNVLRQLGAEYVIGVDIFKPGLRSKWLGPLGLLINGLEILIQRAGLGIETADYLITPDLAGCTYLRFSQREILFRKGYQAAQKELPRLSDELQRLITQQT
jgi:NTE family protein